MSNSIKEAALEYRERGFSVIPLRSRAKTPLIRWQEFQTRRATVDEISGWWEEYQCANIGIITGAISGVVVVDIDGEGGMASLRRNSLHIPPTATVGTGKGLHHYFKHPGNSCKNFAAKLEGVDFRGDAGYVLAPPSVHPNGKAYEWQIPLEDGIAESPGWLLDLMNQETGGRVTPEEWAQKIEKGARNHELARRAGSLLTKMLAGEVVSFLQALNEKHCHPPLPEAEVRQIVESIALREAGKVTAVTAVTGNTVLSEGDNGTIFATFFDDGAHLFEQIGNSGGFSFISYEEATGKVEIVPEFNTGDSVVKPLRGEELEHGAVILPTGVREYGDTADLLAAIENHIRRYLDVSAAFRKFASYYVLLTWLYDRLNTLAYLRALGDTGCGKSRLLDTVGGLCYKPTIVSGCITPAPIYRMIARWGGTLILDEADLKGSDEYNEVVTILNCGFERGRPVIRATRESPDKLRILPVFGPKVFATRQRFKDPALEARCLTEIMQETSRQDIPPVLTKAFYEEQAALREKLLLFRLRNWRKTDVEQAENLDLGKDIEPRLRQISGAFLALFSGQDDALADYRQFIRDHQRELVEQRLATPVGQIVEALFAIIESVIDVTIVTGVTGQGLYTITPSDIAMRLKDVTPQVVGQVLKNLGLKTKPAKGNDSKTRRYLIKDEAKLETLRRRYIPADEGAEATHGSESMQEEFTRIASETGQAIKDYWEGRERATPSDNLQAQIADVSKRIDSARANGHVTGEEFEELCRLYLYLNTTPIECP